MLKMVPRLGALIAVGLLAAGASCGGVAASTADGGAEDATLDGPASDDAQGGQDATEGSIGAPDSGVDVSTIVDGDASAADVSLDAWNAEVGAPDAGADVSTIVDADASTASDAPSGDALDEPDVADACTPFPPPPNNVVSYQCRSSTGQVGIPFQYPLCDATGDAQGGTTPSACQTCETFTCNCLEFESKTQGIPCPYALTCTNVNGVPYVVCQ